MEPSDIVVVGRCMKQDGSIIALFRDGLQGPLVCKVKKADERPR